MCIKALTDGSGHVPFRDSKLTLFLKQSLGGNSKTLLVCTASALERHYEESYQTCRFAKRAKKVKNKATSNIMKSREEMEVFINKLKVEVNALRKQLISHGIKPDPKAFKEKPSASAAAGEEIKEEDKEDESEETKEEDSKISAELGSKLEELQSAYDSYKENAQKRILELEDQVEKAQEEKVDLDTYREKDFEIESLISTVDEKEEKISKLQQEKDKDKLAFEVEIAELNARLKMITTESETLKQDIKEIKDLNEKKLLEQGTLINILQHENTKIKDEFTSLSTSTQAQIDSLKTENSNSLATIEEMNAKEKKLKSTIDEKENELTSLNKKIEEFSIEIFEADEKLEEEKRKLTKQLKNEEELKEKFEEHKQNAIKKEDELKTFQTRLLLEKEEYRIKIMELDKKIEQMEIAVKNDDTKSIIEQKDNLLKSLKEESQAKIDQANAEKEEVTKKLTEEIQIVQQERDALKASYKELENKKEEVDAELSKLESRKNNLEEKIESQTKEIARLNENIQNLKNEVEAQEKKIESRDESLKTLRGQLDEFQQSAEGLEERNKKIQEVNQSEVDGLKIELAGIKAENTILKDKCDQIKNELQKDHDKINERYELAKTDLMKNSEALAKSEAENSELKRQVEKLNKQVNELKIKLNHEKQSAEKQTRASTVAFMSLKKTIAQKVKPPATVIGDDVGEEPEQVEEEVISGPFTRKSTIIKKKVKFGGQVIDPNILNKPDWLLTAQEKYQKSILEHYENLRKKEEKHTRQNYRDANIESYGKDIVYGDIEPDEGVIGDK